MMMEMIEANWIALAVIVVLALLVAWWLLGRNTPPPRREVSDVLSEGAEPARRNTALIDAPPAAAIPPVVPVTPPPAAGTLGGVGEVVAAAATEEVVDRQSVASSADVPAASVDVPAQSAADRAADDLSKIKGVGPKLRSLLAELGIHRYDQIAAWTDEDIARVDPQLGAFRGRIARDNWVEQCRHLASGDTAAYEAKFGKL